MSARHHLAIGAYEATLRSSYAEVSLRLRGKPSPQPKAPCLTLVSPSSVVQSSPTLIDATGRSAKPKPREEADDHVWVHRLYHMRRKEHPSPSDFIKLRCLELRVEFEEIIGPSRERRLIPHRHLVMYETRNRYPSNSLTQERAQQYYTYDPSTGELTHRRRPDSEFRSAATIARHLERVGKPAGTINADGYVKVQIDGAYHSAHKVIWLMVTGEWVEYPKHEIDHKDGDPANNRWSNLRKVTKEWKPAQRRNADNKHLWHSWRELEIRRIPVGRKDLERTTACLSRFVQGPPRSHNRQEGRRAGAWFHWFRSAA